MDGYAHGRVNGRVITSVPMSEQQQADLPEPMLGRRHQRGLAGAVGEVRVGSLPHQELHLHHARTQGRISAHTPGTRRGNCGTLKKVCLGSDRLRIVVLRRQEQRGQPVFPGTDHVHSRRHEVVQRFQVLLSRRDVWQ